MIQNHYKYKVADENTIERIVDDERIHLNHMILTKGTGLPPHASNSNLYMIVVRGTMSIKLGDQEEARYTKGDIVTVPFNTAMNVRNNDEEVLEFFVVKVPNPRALKGRLLHPGY